MSAAIEIEAETHEKVPSRLHTKLRSTFCQRGRGRRGGRAVRERGRMRKRGLRGGGTLRRKSPQQGQWPSPPRGAVASARSQWPRASHCGLIHCTVKPGKNCIFTPSEAAKFKPIRARPFNGGAGERSELPWRPRRSVKRARNTRRQVRRATLRKKMHAESPAKMRGASNVMAGIVPRAASGVKRKDYKILW